MPDRDLAARRLLAVTEEELQRIVLDIHDGPVQNLFAALSQLSLLQAQLAGLPQAGECAAGITRVTRLLEQSLSEIRNLLGTFRSPEFAKLSLPEIIEDMVVQHETLTNDVVKLNLADAVPDVALPTKIALCRILQEALANVHRHSGTTSATVWLWARAGRVFVEVVDQGRGFVPPRLRGPEATERHEHIGLRGMRERAALVGGRLTVESRPGAGTLVRVEVPVHG